MISIILSLFLSEKTGKKKLIYINHYVQPIWEFYPFFLASTCQKKVIIEYENGRRELWGRESSIVEALRVAEGLQLSLRLIGFVRSSLDTTLKDICESLVSDVHVDLVEEIMFKELWQLAQNANFKSGLNQPYVFA